MLPFGSSGRMLRSCDNLNQDLVFGSGLLQPCLRFRQGCLVSALAHGNSNSGLIAGSAIGPIKDWQSDKGRCRSHSTHREQCEHPQRTSRSCCAAFACVDSMEHLRVCDVFQWTRRGSRRRGSNFVSVGIRCLASSDQQPSESKPRLPIRKSTHVSVLRAFATAFSSRPETDGGG